MLSSVYRASSEPRRFEAFGAVLSPLTLDHARLLYLADSPFIVPGNQPIYRDDVALLVAICAEPQTTQLTIAADQLEKEVAAVKEYLAYYASPLPRFDEEPPSPRIPWPWSYVAVLMSEYQYTKKEAWAELCAEAFWLAACAGIRAGDKGLATLAEQTTLQQLEAMD